MFDELKEGNYLKTNKKTKKTKSKKKIQVQGSYNVKYF